MIYSVCKREFCLELKTSDQISLQNGREICKMIENLIDDAGYHLSILQQIVLMQITVITSYK